MVRPWRVGFVLFDRFALLSYAGLREPFEVANRLGGRTVFLMRDVPVSGARARGGAGTFVSAGAQVGESVDFDVVFVVADDAPPREPRVERWLGLLARQGTQLGGIAGGVAVLARAGLLEGYSATPHWDLLGSLAEEHAELSLARGLYTIDRDRLTCAGGAATGELGLELIARHCGEDLARRVRDWLLAGEPRPADEGRRTDPVNSARARHPAVVGALAVMEAHLSEPLSGSALAARVGVGERRLARLFARDLDASPMRVYRDLRLERARSLLERTAMSVGEVALATGFTSFAHFSSAFRRVSGTSPREWRRARAKERGAETGP